MAEESDQGTASEEPAADGDSRIDQLVAAACLRWRAVPPALDQELRALFAGALDAADAAATEVIPVMNPTLRPQRLRLHPLVTDHRQDAMYHQEWSELAVAANGGLYLVYRRRDGDHYAVRYDQGVTLPAALVESLPDTLAEALLGGDG